MKTFKVPLTEDDGWLLTALCRDINRTVYFGGIGFKESGKYLALLDRLIAAVGGPFTKP